jgi:hypothetical protein
LLASGSSAELAYGLVGGYSAGPSPGCGQAAAASASARPAFRTPNPSRIFAPGARARGHQSSQSPDAPDESRRLVTCRAGRGPCRAEALERCYTNPPGASESESESESVVLPPEGRPGALWHLWVEVPHRRLIRRTDISRDIRVGSEANVPSPSRVPL